MISIDSEDGNNVKDSEFYFRMIYSNSKLWKSWEIFLKIMKVHEYIHENSEDLWKLWKILKNPEILDETSDE